MAPTTPRQPDEVLAQAFGYTHGLMVVDTFYENVVAPNGDKQVLQFTPSTGAAMLVPVLWGAVEG